MSIEEPICNIPEISIGETVSHLSGLYGSAIKKGMPLKSMPAPFLWGPAGVGKSEGVYQLAEKLNKSTGRNVHVSVVHLLLFSPVDLRGVPVADEHRRFTDWLKPRIFDMPTGENDINVLFLDELSAAPQSVQAAAYQLTLDRRIGEHTLPDNCIVIAAGNRTTDQSVAYKMPKALCNRLMHFSIKSDMSSWKAWAVGTGIDPRIIGFLGFDPSMLCTEPNQSDLAYPTPRSWSYVDRILKAIDGEPSSCHELISACVGKDAAYSFEQWCRVYNKLPNVEDILCGRCRDYPRKTDELYALSTGLACALIGKGSALRSGELENACAYAARFPAEFAMSFFSDLNTNEALSAKIVACNSFTEWLSRTKRVL